MQLLLTASLAAAYNVRINIGSLDDQAFAGRCAAEVEAATAEIRACAARLEAQVEAALDRSAGDA